MVGEKNDIYLEEIQNKIEEKTGIKVSVSSLCERAKGTRVGLIATMSLPGGLNTSG